MEERLQKILARADFGSRRACEELIREGRVAVNGQVAQLGQKADPGRDHIAVDGRQLRLNHHCTYVAFHKPRGVLSDEGSGHRPTVRDLVPLPGHLFPVGRLDLHSEGLILLTSDGELANLLTHPRYEHTKEYHVCVQGHPEDETLERWRQGVFLDGRQTAPAEVSVLRRGRPYTWLRVVLREGRRRQIRRVAEMLGHRVHRVIRVRIGPVHLGDLKPGEWRHLTRRELKELEELKMPAPRRPTKPSTIAIDGPAAAGKSTIGELLAKRLGYLFLDTGAMYRAVTWVALQRGIDISAEEAITALAESIVINITRPTVDDGRQYTVFADGQDVTWQIRRPEVDANVSPVSAYPGVRQALTNQQRRIGRRGRIVMIGRDIGTVVLPDADLKIYLAASAEERAGRRHREVLERGEESDYEKVLSAMRRRDKIDSEREAAPLRPAEDAIIIDTTGLSVAEVLAKVEELVWAKGD